MIDFDDDVCSALDGPVVEVIAIAKEDLKKGDQLDKIGGFCTYGICENSEIARQENLLPVGLSDGAILKNNIPKDQVITFDDVYFQQPNVIQEIWKEQYKYFKD